MATRVGVNTARGTLVACAASLSLPALSLGLGELEMQSFLNEPLRAEVALLDLRELTEDDIRIRLAGVEDFERLGVDRSYFLTSIQFEVDIDEDSGSGVIRLSTATSVLEPYLDIIVEARWPNGRVLREYTVLVDPPAFRQDMISVSASDRIQDPSPEKPALSESDREAMRAEQRRQEIISSGDTVAVRESSLPPGAMPDRVFSAATTDSPTAGNRYMVKRDETLWQIASRGRPEAISVQQAMLDIQRINPEAFIGGNINRIKAGYIIYLPAEGEVDSTDLAEAIEEVRTQNQAFESRRTPGVSAAATLRVSAEPMVVAREENVQSPTADAASYTTTDEQPDTGTDIDVVEPVAPAMADADSAAADMGSEASELASQMSAMSDRLDTLEQIVSLKDEQIATLEQALQEAREEAAAAAAQAAARPAPAPQGPAPSPPPAETGSFPWIPAAGGLLVLLLGVIFFLRRRASDDKPDAPFAPTKVPAQAEKEDVFAGVSLKKESVDDSASVDTHDSRDSATIEEERDEDALDRGGSRGYGEAKHDDYIDDAQGGDALAEADIYIAYGRYLQAVELLTTAIDSEPGNSAYRLKLIELYVDMGEEANAADQMEALRANGDAVAIERGEALLGAGPTEGTLSKAADEEPASNSTAVDQTDDLASDMDVALGGDLDLELGGGEELDSSIGYMPPASQAVAEPDPDPEPAMPAEPEPDPAAVLDELELDLHEPGPVDVPVAEEPETTDLPATEEPETFELEDHGSVEEVLEFDELEIESEPEADDAPAATGTESEEVLDLTDALSDFENMDLDGEEDSEANEFMIADDADQMATKLDLARAYLDMGDSNGARGILEEVAANGSGEQQQEAQELLERIG